MTRPKFDGNGIRAVTIASAVSVSHAATTDRKSGPSTTGMSPYAIRIVPSRAFIGLSAICTAWPVPFCSA